ncbi:magnesium transporter CorA family protein [Nibricoccus aquaticus]|nr:magnesium transporter CorA family protein [Nibricoccus aquaticus]
MITVLSKSGNRVEVQTLEAKTYDWSDVLWIDLHDPTPDETKMIESALGVELPTRKEAQEIEVSSRLYTENRTLFMTATIMVRADKPDLTTAAVTFIYRKQQLITLRFDSPMPFRTFAQRLERSRDAYPTAQKLLLGLFDEIVDRIADILEFVATDLNDLSATIFMEEPAEIGTVNYTSLLSRIGRNGARTANARESLVSLQRLHGFFIEMCSSQQGEELEESWRIAGKDVAALADHATFISGKVSFFLDATLGRVNSEQNTINSQQNKIIKLFSVLAVVLLPPTLIASIYGMNFQVIPELKWKFGYPFSLALMVVSAVVPYLIFRYKRWL